MPGSKGVWTWETMVSRYDISRNDVCMNTVVNILSFFLSFFFFFWDFLPRKSINIFFVFFVFFFLFFFFFFFLIFFFFFFFFFFFLVLFGHDSHSIAVLFVLVARYYRYRYRQYNVASN